MIISEAVHTFLAKNRPRAFCDDCLQERLGLARRQEVAPVTKTFGLTRGLSAKLETVIRVPIHA